MAAFFADLWFSSDGTSFARVNNDVVDVTCRLLARLKQRTNDDGVRLILYLPFGGSNVKSSPWEAPQSVRVGECARAMDIPTVDEFAKLRAIFEKEPDKLRSYYQVEADGGTGHKSPFGNLEVVRLIQPVIAKFGIEIYRKN